MTLQKISSKSAYLFMVLILAMFAVVRASGQSTGAISGTVSDPTGAAVSEASVTVKNVATGQSRSVQTNTSGVFLFPDLPIGSYTMEITKAGFETQKRTATELLTGTGLEGAEADCD